MAWFTTAAPVQEKPAQGSREGLSALHDIALPETVSWMPHTVGWYVVLAVGLGFLVWVGLRIHRRRVANRYRGLALEELGIIERAMGIPEDRTAALSRLPLLVKRVALSFAPREQVASLTGGSWLAWLDQSYGSTGFTQGPGRVLPNLAYASIRDPGSLEEAQKAELIALVRTWIQTHDAGLLSLGAKDV